MTLLKVRGFIHKRENLKQAEVLVKKGLLMQHINIRKVVELHSENANFSLNAVIQKELRDRDYYVLTQKSEIDNIIKLDYNVDNI